jgi:hypothetical protein
MALLPIHIIGGFLALASGYIALYATKGAPAHRKSGTVFVAAMVVMSLTGAYIAVLHDEPVSVVAGLLTFYFVATAMLTVSPLPSTFAAVAPVAMLYATIVSIAAIVTGFAIVGSGRPEGGPMFIFGGLGLLAAKGDWRVIRAHGIQGRPRIARHLWRMCFAMWVAAASFFWGPQGRVPEIIRIPTLQAIAVLLPVAVMVFWLWRLRARNAAAPKSLHLAEAR